MDKFDYLEILDFWFPDDNYHSWWFNNKKKDINIDRLIYDKFYNKLIEFNFDILDNIDSTTLTKEFIISSIILLDQFSRNINRITNNLDIYYYTKKAHILTKIWIDRKYYLILPVKYTVFAFLPIRHLKDKNDIKNMIMLLDEIKLFNPQIEFNEIYKKFYFNSIKSFKLFSQID